MKKILFIVLICFTINTYAYTKEDISSLKDDFIVCDADTTNLINGLSVTYSRLLNERNVTDTNIDIIYNNILKVKDILNYYKICSINDKNKIPDNVIEELQTLYNNTNDIILNSETYTNSNNNINIVIDTKNNEIKVYEDDSLLNIITTTNNFNYVGINKYVSVIIYLLLSVLFVIIINKKNTISISILYVIILLLPLIIFNQNKLSIILDNISMFNRIDIKEKKVVVKDNKIISYPSINTKYATISLNGYSSDVYYGDSDEVLKLGIGEDENSSLFGESGTTILSGHNTGLFMYLNDLNIDDEVLVETIYANFKYKVVEKEVLNYNEKDKLKDYDLVLYTCLGSSLYTNERLVVYLNLVEEKWV